jgi:RNA 3'-terminal phosphate cyclase (ATP)
VILTLASEEITEVFTGLGERGLPAETVAGRVAEEAGAYLAAGVPVGPYLADQLLLPLALAGAGSFVTTRPTLHATTAMAVIEQFLGIRMAAAPLAGGQWRIEVG